MRNLLPCTLAFSCLVTPALTGCTKSSIVNEISCRDFPVPCLQGAADVLLDTSRGSVLIRLDGENAPITAGNFVDLVKRGVYNQTAFHRVIRTPVPFVVQGGDPSSTDPTVPKSDYGSGHFIDKKTGEARFIPLEFRDKISRKFIYGKEAAPASSTIVPILSHTRGSIAMARSSDPNSASAQFYISLEALPELDGRYAVFGRVIRGMEIVDQLQQGDKLIRASIVKN